MSGSSELNSSEFDGLRHHQVAVLLQVLAESELAAEKHLERRFLERAPRFKETLAFLTGIGAIQNVDGMLSTTSAFETVQLQDPIETQGAVLSLLLHQDSAYRREMLDYIQRFGVVDGTAVYAPSVEARSAESAVRNYLMDLGIVSFDGAKEHYVLRREHSCLYALARRSHRMVSPAQLSDQIRAREDIGLRAEKQVLCHERQRVGERFKDQVDHVAVRDVTAGYDILSVTVCEDGDVVPRYIEVKAVPPEDYRFYWSANEMDMAQMFGAWYYLYLVPVSTGGGFNIGSLRMLSDPHKAVLGPGSEWIVEKDIVRCSLDTDAGVLRDWKRQ